MSGISGPEDRRMRQTDVLSITVSNSFSGNWVEKGRKGRDKVDFEKYVFSGNMFETFW